MKNPFETHGIEHLSPSSLNTFAQSSAAFVLTKLLKRTGAMGAPAHRGTAVETGVALMVGDRTKSLSDGITAALDNFQTLTALSGDPRTEKEREAIPAMVEQGFNLLKALGLPSAMQERVELKVDGLPVPIIGFIDFRFGSTIIDLKSTHALPSKINNSNHARQVALYVAATGGDSKGFLGYVTSKKSALYQIDDAQAQVDALIKIAFTLQKFLSVSDDPAELAQLVVPDVDSFWFSNDPLQRQAAKDVWGI